MTIRAAIVGYGNLGRSVEDNIKRQDDIELVGIFSRRTELDTGTKVFPVADIDSYVDDIDVLYLCIGSATDIPEQATKYAAKFTTVDTYDNHKRIPEHYEAMDEVAYANDNVAIISTGWDPGLFSLNRTLASSLFPQSQQNTFWGKGVSQGHSDALRRIDGVQKAVQYTIPREDAIESARSGNGQDITGHNAHLRQCWIVADPADHERIENEIRTMPDYFVGYEVEVHFISEEEFVRDHQGLPHGGHVITSGDLGGTHNTVEFSLDLNSNPAFTAAVQVAYGRAAYRLKEAGQSGAFSVLEVPPYLLAPQSLEELLARDV
ncbi:diaminopimelate dehydrogenase [Flaviflexus massiliensis]|uniref:diaminopimelate dehydrogenase n=1 Tax=Flaviflexus massiliensis TaxID=1522309 RepID=UPI0006D5797E|nr:diaminopimelate dehydrogenase [Flaviflexus massiliensis]